MTRNDLSEQEKTDFLTLSRTDCMFWCGKGYNTFHLKHCVKLKGLTHITGFSRAKDAIRDGYRPCRMCKPTTRKGLEMTLPFFSKAVPGESDEVVRERCLESRHIYRIVDSCSEIETGFGIWQIKSGSITYLPYHINKVVEPNNTTDFHQQPHIFLSLSDVVAYIINHDRKAGRIKCNINL